LNSGGGEPQKKFKNQSAKIKIVEPLCGDKINRKRRPNCPSSPRLRRGLHFRFERTQQQIMCWWIEGFGGKIGGATEVVFNFAVLGIVRHRFHNENVICL
jgi:hypothetical protein